MILDAHLDLAYLEACGRRMGEPNISACGGPDLPAAVTLPALTAAGVSHALATVFTECDGKDEPIAYAADDAEGAYGAGARQLQIYENWERSGWIQLWRGGPDGLRPLLRPAAESPTVGQTAARALHVGILVECADPIRTPDELEWWVRRGVVAIGMAWVKRGRYAGGNSTALGVTDLGFALIREMDRLRVLHDASHLSDRALEDLFDATDRVIVATHSNCRSILLAAAERASGLPPGIAPAPDVPAFQRHLTNSQIREIARRGGVIGLNLFSPFLIPGGLRNRRATVAEAIRHVEHICELVGDRNHVGLGSDMDGGFSAAALPEGIDGPAGLIRLGEALRDVGWNDSDIEGFWLKNWARVLSQV